MLHPFLVYNKPLHKRQDVFTRRSLPPIRCRDGLCVPFSVHEALAADGADEPLDVDPAKELRPLLPSFDRRDGTREQATMR